MERRKAFQVLLQHKELPMFNVKIGVGSPQTENCCFSEALAEFDRCIKFRDKDRMEYLFMYCSEFVDGSIRKNVDEALSLLDLGTYKWTQ